MLGSGLGLRIVLGCKVDKIFLRAPLVPMEHGAPLAKLLHCVRTTQTLCTHCVGIVCALRARARKLTQDHLPPVCWHSKWSNPTR